MTRLWTFLDALVLWLHDRGVPVRRVFAGALAVCALVNISSTSEWGRRYDAGFWTGAAFGLPAMTGLTLMALFLPETRWNLAVDANRRGWRLLMLAGLAPINLASWIARGDWREGVCCAAGLLFAVVGWSKLPTRPPRPRRRTSPATRLAWSPS